MVLLASFTRLSLPMLLPVEVKAKAKEPPRQPLLLKSLPSSRPPYLRALLPSPVLPGDSMPPETVLLLIPNAI